jgi:hypothetical protein
LKFPPYDAEEKLRNSFLNNSDWQKRTIIISFPCKINEQISVYRVRALTLGGIAVTKSRKKEKQTKSDCLELFATTFNIFYVLVDK